MCESVGHCDSNAHVAPVPALRHSIGDDTPTQTATGDLIIRSHKENTGLDVEPWQSNAIDGPLASGGSQGRVLMALPFDDCRSWRKVCSAGMAQPCTIGHDADIDAAPLLACVRSRAGAGDGDCST